MRSIGQLPTSDQAHVLIGHLYSLGIESEAEEDGGAWTLWVAHDDDVARASAELAAFLANPADPRFAESARQGESQWKAEKKRVARSRANEVDVRTRVWGRSEGEEFPFLTLGLLVISVGTFVYQMVPAGDFRIENVFQIASQGARGSALFSEVLSGQIWRLLTPIFLHFGIFHLLFNMMWLKDLGALIEHFHGTAMMATVVVASALLSNAGQYLVSGPNFGGMSGVVYALLGFVWMRHRFDPAVAYHIPRHLVVGAIIWFFACMTGALGPVANMAHGVGLVVGMVLGYGTSGHPRRWLARSG